MASPLLVTRCVRFRVLGTLWDGVLVANHEANENKTEPIQPPKQVSSDDNVNRVGTSRIVPGRAVANTGVAGRTVTIIVYLHTMYSNLTALPHDA